MRPLIIYVAQTQILTRYRYGHGDTYNLLKSKTRGTLISILYNYKLYKLTINIYVHKYVSNCFGVGRYFS